MQKLKVVCGAAVLCVLAGCSSGYQFQSFAKQFPSEQKLDELKRTDSKAQFRDASDDGRVPHWKLNGPFPSSFGSQTVRSTTPVGQGVDAAFTQGKMTSSMACVARESGIFYAHYERYPYNELREFIGQRCGSVAGAYRSIAMLNFGDSNATEAEVAKSDSFAEWASEVADAYDSKDGEYGVWFGTGRKGKFAVIAAAKPTVRVESVPLVLSGKKEVVLKGQVLVDVDSVFAVATKGEYDTSDCVTSTGVDLPNFEITCPIDPADPTISISLNRGREGDVFARWAAEPRFWLSESPTDLFVAAGTESPVPESPTTVSSGADTEGTAPAAVPRYVRPELVTRSLSANNVAPSALRERFLARVNSVRSQAGRPALSLENLQSDVNSELLPYMIGEDDEDLRNEAVLGALAGWAVQGKIINGNVQFQTFYNANIDDMVVSVLKSASGRRALLGEELDSTAIGSIYDEGTGGVGVAFTSYQYVDETPHLERVNTFLDKLAKARKSRGLSPPRKVSALKPVADNLDKRVRAGTMSFQEAAQDLMNESFEHYQRDTYMYAGAAHDPMRLTFDERILSMEPLRMSIMVTPFKPEGSPWYSYGVVIVYPKTNEVAPRNPGDG